MASTVRREKAAFSKSVSWISRGRNSTLHPGPKVCMSFSSVPDFLSALALVVEEEEEEDDEDVDVDVAEAKARLSASRPISRLGDFHLIVLQFVDWIFSKWSCKQIDGWIYMLTTEEREC